MEFKFEDLMKMSDEELRKLNKNVVAILNGRAERKVAKAKFEFGLYQEVKFTNPKTGRSYVGKIVKMNPKKAHVKVAATQFEKETTWFVPYTMLSPVK